MNAILDHLVYATPDLDATIADLGAQLGVRAAYGGRHPGRGTRNALIALSEFSYLEIVGPDDTQHDIIRPRWLGVDELTGPRMVTWAVKSSSIETLTADAARAGVVLGRITSGSRQTPSGETLTWQLSDPAAMVENGVVPFFIDWGRSAHPATSAPRGPALLSLSAEHPEPARVERVLSALGVKLPVSRAIRPALVARLRTSAGDVELR
jgi:hypothetical protein